MPLLLCPTSIQSDVTIDLGYNMFLVNATSNNITITFPAITGDGINLLFNRTDTTTHTVTLNTTGSNTIYGSTSIKSGEVIRYVSYGTTWYSYPESNIIGTTGSTGATGQTVAINSIFVWSEKIQKIGAVSTSHFVPIAFEFGPIGPSTGSWSGNTGQTGSTGSTGNTQFRGTVSGWYLLTYKVDLRSGFSGLHQPSATNGASALTINGIQVQGSQTIVSAPETNHIYTITNTVLYNYTAGDNIALWVWANASTAQVGDTILNAPTGPTLNGANVTEATASMIITRIA